MPDSFIDFGRLEAVIFDLDGTLYRQPPLRRAMARRMLQAYALRPFLGLRTIRGIAAYRRAQEELRAGPGAGDLAEAQLALASQHSGRGRDALAEDVARWIEVAPLSILSRFAMPGLDSLLATLRARGVKLGVLSDYQAEGKLRALGIFDCFDSVLSAQDPAIGVFKPHPRGLQLTLEHLGVSGPRALYVGDRAEVDASAAAAADVPCAILAKAGAHTGHGYLAIADFRELQDRLETHMTGEAP